MDRRGTGSGLQSESDASTKEHGQVRHHSEWERTPCGKCNFMDRATCRLFGRQRQEEDTVIAGDADELLPGTQPARNARLLTRQAR